MRENDRDSQVDRRIDAALRTYAEPPQVPDPRAVALQLLQRAREVEPRAKWPIWSWAIPAFLIALAIAAGYLLRAPRIPEVARAPVRPRVVAQARIPAPPARCASVSAMHRKLTHLVKAKPQPLPRLAVFPTPTPLSPQEKALIAFAKHAPPAVQRAVIEDQKHWDDPIIVAGLQSHPLQAARLQDQ